MKDSNRRMALLAGVAILGLASAYRVQADSENSAVVINDYEAFVNLRDIGLFLLTTDTQLTLTKDGYLSAQCHFEIPDGDWTPNEALIYDDLNCVFFGIPTSDCSALVTPSGEVMLRAKLLPSSD